MAKRTQKTAQNALQNETVGAEIETQIDTTLPETDGHVADRENEPTEAELEAFKNEELRSEAYEAQSNDTSVGEVQSDEAPSEEPVSEDDADEPKSLQEIMDGFDRDDVLAMQKTIAFEIDERMDYEAVKGNETIQKSLKSSRAKMTTDLMAAYAFAACEADPLAFNIGRASTNRYNVYAIDKVADLARSLASGQLFKNAINRAVCRSLFTFLASGEKFTMDIAKAACSDKIRISAATSRHLVRHTVSASTAPTQASSTMQALQTLGIVKNVGTGRGAIYELTDTAQTRALKAICDKAA